MSNTKLHTRLAKLLRSDNATPATIMETIRTTIEENPDLLRALFPADRFSGTLRVRTSWAPDRERASKAAHASTKSRRQDRAERKAKVVAYLDEHHPGHEDLSLATKVGLLNASELRPPQSDVWSISILHALLKDERG